MNSKQKCKTAKLLLGFVAASSTAALAATKFPYVGHWGKNVRYADGSSHQIVLTFANDGSCSYKVNNLKFPSRADCSYRMQGTSALLTLKLHAVIKGVNRDSILTNRVIPQANGQSVSIQPLELSYMKEGKWTTKKAKGKPVTLDRLK